MSYHTSSSRQSWHDSRTGNDPFAMDQIEDTPHLTHDDMCANGKAGLKCRCEHCTEMRARERDTENRI